MKTPYTNTLGMSFSPIQAGSFLMGDPPDTSFHSENTGQHRVQISRGFAMQTTTVTVGQWRVFADETGYQTLPERTGGWTWVFQKHSQWKFQWLIERNAWVQSPAHCWKNPGFPQNDDYPVTCVTWNDAKAFVSWLSQKEGKQYRLPTEAEWEYVCRANTQTNYYFGDRLSIVHARYYSNLISLVIRIPHMNDWFNINSPVPVQTFHPNRWGIYNMHGNVWEWCEDSCDKSADNHLIHSDAYRDTDAVDPLGKTGEYHLLRGGSWAYPDVCCRSAYRRAEDMEYSASGIGFRLVIT